LRTVVYVDGYSLYYGLLRKTTLKWLDLYALFRDHVLDSEVDLVEVRYYTAPVLGRMCDDQESPQRQRRYLQALRKMYPAQNHHCRRQDHRHNAFPATGHPD